MGTNLHLQAATTRLAPTCFSELDLNKALLSGDALLEIVVEAFLSEIGKIKFRVFFWVAFVKMDTASMLKAVGRAKEMMDNGEISECEFVCCYLLLHASRNPSWYCGTMQCPIVDSSVHELPKSISLETVPGLIRIPKKLDPKLGILELFNTCNVKSLKKFVNESLVHWSLNERPYVLFYEIPTPQEVLNMMIHGSRCITVFIDEHNLFTHFKDTYPPYIERDAFSFTVHDIQHMEQFVDPDTKMGQVFY